MALYVLSLSSSLGKGNRPLEWLLDIARGSLRPLSRLWLTFIYIHLAICLHSLLLADLPKSKIIARWDLAFFSTCWHHPSTPLQSRFFGHFLIFSHNIASHFSWLHVYTQSLRLPSSAIMSSPTALSNSSMSTHTSSICLPHMQVWHKPTCLISTLCKLHHITCPHLRHIHHSHEIKITNFNKP